MSPRGRKDDDLFKDSSMSFGEHLMELRRCLIIAIIWLVGGFILAMIPIGSLPSLATLTVAYVQRPLKKSLEHFYINQSTNRLKNQGEYLTQLGYSNEISQVPSKYKMTAREFWIFPEDRSKLESVPNITIPPELPTAETTEATKTSAVSDTTSEKKERSSASSAETEVKPQMILLWEKLSDDARTRTKALNMPETFMIFIRAAVLIGILLGSPGIFYSFWSFVGAGLYPQEKRMVYRFFPLSLSLFIGGFCLAFFVVFEFVLTFLLRFNAGMNIDPDPRISEWLNFAIILPVGFGIMFQLPLVMFVLYRLRIFKMSDYIRRWKIAILVIAVASMMFTPPDPWSMICMMVPVISLYYLGISLCFLFPAPKSDFDQVEEKDSEENEKSDLSPKENEAINED